ncbi:transmembrane and ubiquitin-like domain-containing protein 1 isoform 1-T2 [Neosynchiropus ocellatus]
MALIEGVGDEVTLLFGSLLVLLVLLLAWTSTHTSEPPDHLFTSSAPTASPRRETVPDTPGSSGVVTAPSSSVSESSDTSPPDVAAQGDEDKEDDGPGQDEGGESTLRNMVVRLKFLNDTERTAHVCPFDTVGYIKRTYFAGQEQRVRLIYRGQLLQDDSRTLLSLNLVHNCVLHCHISQHAAGAGPGVRPTDQVQVALNVGSLMVPLLVLMLSVLWYCQIQYRQFFTAPATASLVGITIFLSLVAFGVYRH